MSVALTHSGSSTVGVFTVSGKWIFTFFLQRPVVPAVCVDHPVPMLTLSYF